MAEPILRLQGVHKSFGRGRHRIQALEDVDLEARPGEILGLLGNNGAGKSTLLRILAALLLPDRGSIHVVGLDALHRPRRVRQRIGLCGADERSFYARLSGEENLRLFGTLKGLSGRRLDTRIRELLALLGLEEHAQRPVQTYSTGNRQRLNVARALVHDPPILLLDEATKAADPGTADLIRSTVRDHWVGRQGKTVVYVTHDLHGFEGFCHRVVVLDRGRVHRCGTPAEVLDGGPGTLRDLLRRLGGAGR